ncbi:uncharacterized protein LOC117229675 [Megalopta genalis]|uniref:uncharacterized protein LOC117229675 n=1 Tax=Megalopta genalis TaxID=115081 RepID=UPI003FCFD3C8
MRVSWILYSCLVLIVSVSAKKEGNQCEVIRAGYIPGQSGMPKINEKNCVNDELLDDSDLSNALQCARTCRPGKKPRICYYKFVIERYSVNGQACQLCSPNITNTICANCQCITTDGTPRTAVTVNRMIPGPSIQVCLGDRIVVDVTNLVSENAVTIHWHGVLQEGTQYYDGVPNLTQCPINSATTFRYQFYANNAGTHFWHAHTGLNKMDGVFGSLIIREPAKNEPNWKLYNFDLANHVIVINDWMREESTERYPGRSSGVVGQSPDSILINGKTPNSTTNSPHEVITVDPNRRFRFRLVNAFCTTCAGELSVQGHNLTVVAMDGVSVKPVVVDAIVSSAGERYDFIINTNQKPGAYWIRVRGLVDCAGKSMQALALLQYVNAPTTPFIAEPKYNEVAPQRVILNQMSVNCTAAKSDAICISNMRNSRKVDDDLSGDPDIKLFYAISARNIPPKTLFKPNTYEPFTVPFPNGTASDMIDHIHFVNPPSPPLSQLDDLPEGQFCNAEDLPEGCDTSHCTCTHMVHIPLNSLVEIGLVDGFGVPLIQHPFHLHGYSYNVLAMGQPFGPSDFVKPPMTVADLEKLDRDGKIRRNFHAPPNKDTISVPNNGYVIFRFRAHNPGFWLFHCHIIYHQLNGMEMILRVGHKSDLPHKPKDFPRCGNFMPKICKGKKRK